MRKVGEKMQDRYAGDVGDFGKLGMLRKIACFRNLEIRALRNLRISSLAKRIIYNEE